MGSWDNIVAIATDYVLDEWGVGVWIPVGCIIFFVSSRRALRSTQPPIQWYRGVKLTTHLQLSKVKKMWIYTVTPP
jgi:hypothetical protein